MKKRIASDFGPLLIGLLMLAAGLLALLPQAWRNELLPARFDNIGHLVAFFVLSLFSAFQWPHRRMLASLLLLLFGAAIELLQLFTPTHSASMGDFFRDLLGIAAGMAAALMLQAGRRLARACQARGRGVTTCLFGGDK